jgi:hypothetical protein
MSNVEDSDVTAEDDELVAGGTSSNQAHGASAGADDSDDDSTDDASYQRAVADHEMGELD